MSDGRRLGSLLDPRQSLGARVLWILLPCALIPLAVFWFSTERFGRRVEGRLRSLLLPVATRQAEESLTQAAEFYRGELDERVRELTAVLGEASRVTAAALQVGPGNEPPSETFVDEPNLPFQVAGSRASTALVSRVPGLTEEARRDVEATRGLEPRFSDLIAGHRGIPSIFVMTRSGVFRTVPKREVGALLQSRQFLAAFGVAAQSPPGQHATPAIRWKTKRDTGRTDRLVTASLPVFNARGETLAEVAIDWAVADVLTIPSRPPHPSARTYLFDNRGEPLLIVPEPDDWGRRDAVRLGKSLSTESAPLRSRVLLPSGEMLLATRRTRDGWTCAMALPLVNVEQQVADQVRPLADEALEARGRVEQVYLASLALVALAVVFFVGRALAPVRRLAAFADSLLAGLVLPPLPGLERRDEIGPLARAMRSLEERIRRRVRFLEGIHELSRTASVMTLPEETLTRLSRRIGELVGATKAWIYLYDPDTKDLVAKPPGFGVPNEGLKGLRMGLDTKSLSALAFRTGETVDSREILTDPRVAPPLVERLGLRHNAVFVPLKTEEGTLGVICVADKPDGFDAEDRGLIESYADQAALLLRNARLYEQLQESYEKLHQTYRNRDHFLQNVNHELRTPLTAILGWSEILVEDRPDPETVSAAMEQIRRSAEFVLTLISDLLDLAGLEEGGARLARKPVDVGIVLHDAIDPIAVIAEARQILLTVKAPPRGEAIENLDPLRIRQLLWNLVHNAVKYTPAGGRIDVEAEVGPAGTTIRVTDTGIGIDPVDLPHIFERFRRGEREGDTEERGTGIGLALAKGYAEQHGGRIDVTSEPGRGTSFRVTLPRVA